MIDPPYYIGWLILTFSRDLQCQECNPFDARISGLYRNSEKPKALSYYDETMIVVRFKINPWREKCQLKKGDGMIQKNK